VIRQVRPVRYEQARAHNGLAHTCHAAGDPGQARRHWKEALTLYISLGAPETDQVRTHPAATDAHAAIASGAGSRREPSSSAERADGSPQVSLPGLPQRGRPPRTRCARGGRHAATSSRADGVPRLTHPAERRARQAA